MDLQESADAFVGILADLLKQQNAKTAFFPALSKKWPHLTVWSFLHCVRSFNAAWNPFTAVLTSAKIWLHCVGKHKTTFHNIPGFGDYALSAASDSISFGNLACIHPRTEWPKQGGDFFPRGFSVSSVCFYGNARLAQQVGSPSMPPIIRTQSLWHPNPTAKIRKT